jgi:MFS transporter, ACS family, hexuronate transporter
VIAGNQSPTESTPSWLGSDLGFERRWIICGFLFLVTSINYLDRQVFSILIPDLQRDMHISELAYGRLVMAFQLSYAIMLVVAGKILDRIGARVGLAFAVAIWSLAEIGHVFARTAFGFGIARFFLGLGEAANFPACMKVIADLFPADERATATGIMNSATAAGAIAAPLMVPLLVERYGWQSAFVVTGMAGFIWIAGWFYIHKPKQSSSRRAPSTAPSSARAIPWRTLLGFRQLWTIALARMLVDPIWYFYLFWLPKLLAGRYGITGTAATPYLTAIYVCSGIGCIGSGYLSSSLIKAGWTVNRSRKTVMWALVIIMSPTLLVAHRTGSVAGTMALIGLAVGAHQALSTHLYTLASDLFPSRVNGMVVGLASCLSALASVGTAEIIGRVLENDPTAYVVLFAAAACLYPVAMLVIQILSPKLTPANIDYQSVGL